MIVLYNFSLGKYIGTNIITVKFKNKKYNKYKLSIKDRYYNILGFLNNNRNILLFPF